MVERAEFVREDMARSAEWRKVRVLADALFDHLESVEVSARIELANLPGQSSAAVQAAIVEEAVALGFTSEAKGLFASYRSQLRPDFYFPIGDSGILLEVERGKTTINNMDLLDFWKCHICEHADYLFLLVPTELRQNAKMSPRREFATVSKRLASFFEPGNRTNVRGLVLLGY